MPQRIATLLPSATEIVCALGLADRIVGVSHECDYPPQVRGRPVLTQAKIDPSGSSIEIDRRVRGLVEDGLSVYRVLEDRLREARPDVIVTQDQCEVCAVSLGEVRECSERILGKSVDIVSLSPNTMDDVLGDFLRVGDATESVAAATRLVEQSRERLQRIADGAKRARSKPRVACIEWIEPLMAGGNWIPELVRMCGATYEQSQPGEHSTTITWDDLCAYAPDVVLLMPCGFDLEQTRRELPALRENARWQSLPAVRNKRVYSVDGNAYMNRPGPRLVDSAEIIAGLVQPDLFAGLIPDGSYARVESNQ